MFQGCVPRPHLSAEQLRNWCVLTQTLQSHSGSFCRYLNYFPVSNGAKKERVSETVQWETMLSFSSSRLLCVHQVLAFSGPTQTYGYRLRKTGTFVCSFRARASSSARSGWCICVVQPTCAVIARVTSPASNTIYADLCVCLTNGHDIVCACVRAFVQVCVRVCVRACMRVWPSVC